MRFVQEHRVIYLCTGLIMRCCVDKSFYLSLVALLLSILAASEATNLLQPHHGNDSSADEQSWGTADGVKSACTIPELRGQDYVDGQLPSVEPSLRSSVH